MLTGYHPRKFTRRKGIFIQQRKNAEALDEIEKAVVDFDIDDNVISTALEIRNNVGKKEIDVTSRKNATVSLCMMVKK